MKHIESIKHVIASRTFDTLKKAHDHSESIRQKTTEITDRWIDKRSLDASKLCFVAVGSIGRREALQASDLDLVPIVVGSDCTNLDSIHTDLRELLKTDLGLEVSRGEDLTRPMSLDDLADPHSIGGEKDTRARLSQRILILTESAQAGGGFPLSRVREKLLSAYAVPERSAGRHALSLCNDLARYYRTVCIDYKAKVDGKDLDWATRNVKLRHSRKFFFFATLLAIASLGARTKADSAEFISGLNAILEQPPTDRLVSAIDQTAWRAVGRTLDHYAHYLDLMSVVDRRRKLAAVKYDDRYTDTNENPFPILQYNSKLLHQSMLAILDCSGVEIRRRVMDWFLL
ncbi:MAG: hypothetical protein HY286_09210 [Planctomycetes bacterium]|nr:hypothetical protein [Planctomycetota bacterium]